MVSWVPDLFTFPEPVVVSWTPDVSSDKGNNRGSKLSMHGKGVCPLTGAYSAQPKNWVFAMAHSIHFCMNLLMYFAIPGIQKQSFSNERISLAPGWPVPGYEWADRIRRLHCVIWVYCRSGGQPSGMVCDPSICHSRITLQLKASYSPKLISAETG